MRFPTILNFTLLLLFGLLPARVNGAQTVEQQLAHAQRLASCIQTVAGVGAMEYPLLADWAEKNERENILDLKVSPPPTNYDNPVCADLFGVPVAGEGLDYLIGKDVHDLAEYLAAQLLNHPTAHGWMEEWWWGLEIDGPEAAYLGRGETPAGFAIEVLRYALYHIWMADRYGYEPVFVPRARGWLRWNGTNSTGRCGGLCPLIAVTEMAGATPAQGWAKLVQEGWVEAYWHYRLWLVGGEDAWEDANRGPSLFVERGAAIVNATLLAQERAKNYIAHQVSNRLRERSDNTNSPMWAGTLEFVAVVVDAGDAITSSQTYMVQGIEDYENGGTLAIINRYNPMTDAFEMFYGFRILDGPDQGKPMTTGDRVQAGLFFASNFLTLASPVDDVARIGAREAGEMSARNAATPNASTVRNVAEEASGTSTRTAGSPSVRGPPVSKTGTGLTNAEKGLIGEEAARRTMQRAGYKEMDARLPSNHGFDGVWVKRNADGNIVDIVITESKFTSSGRPKLPKTNMGKQMSMS